MASSPSPRWSAEERFSWPSGHKRCRDCLLVLPYEEFHLARKGLGGREARCRPCRRPRSRSDYAASLERGTAHVPWTRAKSRASARGLEFTITPEDIAVPEACPVFGAPLIPGHPIWAPSLDRFRNAQGYVPGNIRVISTRANVLKNDATAEEIAAVLEYMRGV